MQSFEDVPFIIEKNKRGKRPKKPGSGRRGLKVVVVLLLLCGLAAVGVVVYFSFSTRTFTVKGRTLYAVRLYTTENEAEAEGRAAAVKAAGGAGYIYNDGVYAVVAAVYGDKTDANRVADNNDGQMIEWGIASVKLPIYDDVATSQTVSDCMRYPFTVAFDRLCQIALNLESKTLSESAAALQIVAVKNELLDKRQTLDDLLTRFAADNVLMKTAAAYSDAAVVLECTATSGESLAARVRYAAAAVAARFKQLTSTDIAG